MHLVCIHMLVRWSLIVGFGGIPLDTCLVGRSRGLLHLPFVSSHWVFVHQLLHTTVLAGNLQCYFVIFELLLRPWLHEVNDFFVRLIKRQYALIFLLLALTHLLVPLLDRLMLFLLLLYQLLVGGIFSPFDVRPDKLFHVLEPLVLLHLVSVLPIDARSLILFEFFELSAPLLFEL